MPNTWRRHKHAAAPEKVASSHRTGIHVQARQILSGADEPSPADGSQGQLGVAWPRPGLLTRSL